MQSEFLLDDHPKCGSNNTSNNKVVDNNNTYKVADNTQNRKKKSSYSHSNQTPRLDSVNGLSMISDNLPGSSMSVADITLTMSNEEGQNIVCLEQTTHLDSGVEDDRPPSSLLFLPSPRLRLSQDSPCLIPQCSNPICENDTCSWHRCILKYPQHVRWMPNTITIELTRSTSRKSFGFYTKAKELSQADKKSKDIYVLVKKVEPDGPAAQAGLAVGDFVRSVNYVALHSSQEYNKFVNSTLKQSDKLMMQIQRPDNISVKEGSVLDEFINDQKSPIPLAKPQSPSTSPDMKFSPCSPSNEAIPLRPVRSKAKCRLPQARLVVCGNRTNEFMRCFMGGFIHFPPESHASYHHVSLERSRQNNSSSVSVSVSNYKSFSCMGRESSSTSSPEDSGSINVDIISVASDNFFHHCAPWIFFPDTVFILTFDVNRLAQFSDAEMARLSSLKHTVHAAGGSSGLSCGVGQRLKLVGVVIHGEDVHLEEITTLFYTSLGKTLPRPDFVTISSSRTKEMEQFQAEIFQCVTDISMQSQVVTPVLNAMDCLISHQNLTITNQELSSALMNWNLGSNAEHLTNLVDDLKRTANLLSTCHFPHSGSLQEYIIPSKLFDCIVHITMSADKLQSPSSGIIPRDSVIKYFELFTSDPVKLLTCMEDLGIVYSMEVKSQNSPFCEAIGIMFPFLLEEITSDDIPTDGYHEMLTIQLSDSIASSSFLSWQSKLSRSCHRFEMLGQAAARFTLEGLDLMCIWNKIQNHISLLDKRSFSHQSSTTISQQTLLQRIENSLVPSLATLRSPFLLNWTEDRLPKKNREPGIDMYDPESHYYTRGINIIQHDAKDFLSMLGDIEGAEENTMLWLLDCQIDTIPFLTFALKNLHRFLSINNTWEVFAALLGCSTKQIHLYASVIATNPNRLPSETFFNVFTHEKSCCLGDILSCLVQMSMENTSCHNLAKELMVAAVNGYNRQRQNSSIPL